jgi:hypothetical protein
MRIGGVNGSKWGALARGRMRSRGSDDKLGAELQTFLSFSGDSLNIRAREVGHGFDPIIVVAHACARFGFLFDRSNQIDVAGPFGILLPILNSIVQLAVCQTGHWPRAATEVFQPSAIVLQP